MPVGKSVKRPTAVSTFASQALESVSDWFTAHSSKLRHAQIPSAMATPCEADGCSRLLVSFKPCAAVLRKLRSLRGRSGNCTVPVLVEVAVRDEDVEMPRIFDPGEAGACRLAPQWVFVHLFVHLLAHTRHGSQPTSHCTRTDEQSNTCRRGWQLRSEQASLLHWYAPEFVANRTAVFETPCLARHVATRPEAMSTVRVNVRSLT